MAGRAQSSNLDMQDRAKLVVLQILRAYKWAISPLFLPACRYVPTCSEYAMEAVDRYGVVRGAWLAGLRLLRCHPFARGGYDPVVKANAGTNAPRPINLVAGHGAAMFAEDGLERCSSPSLGFSIGRLLHGSAAAQPLKRNP